jgi:putative ABC transport system permease protein
VALQLLVLMAFPNDLRHAVRTLRASSGFAAAVVATLAAGITISTSAIAVFSAYLLHGLPYPGADRLYSVRYAAPGQDEPRGMSALDWRSLGDVIEHPVAWDLDVFYLLGGEHAEPVPGAWVTPGFLEALGVRPALGRGLEAQAFTAGALE